MSNIEQQAVELDEFWTFGKPIDETNEKHLRDWKSHAYPLQQIKIVLQGTRHSDRASIIEQLKDVLAALRAGELRGAQYDDDFGFKFQFVDAANTSVFSDDEQ